MMMILNATDIFPGPSQLAEATPEQNSAEASANDFASLLAASYVAAIPPASNIELTPELPPTEGSFSFAASNNPASTNGNSRAATKGEAITEGGLNSFTELTGIKQTEILPEINSIASPNPNTVASSGNANSTVASAVNKPFSVLPNAVTFAAPNTITLALPSGETAVATPTITTTELNQIVKEINQDTASNATPFAAPSEAVTLHKVAPALFENTPTSLDVTLDATPKVTPDVTAATAKNLSAVELNVPLIEITAPNDITAAPIKPATNAAPLPNAIQIALDSRNGIANQTIPNSFTFTSGESSQKVEDFSVAKFNALPEPKNTDSASLPLPENIQVQFSADKLTSEKSDSEQTTSVNLENVASTIKWERNEVAPNRQTLNNALPTHEISANFPPNQIEAVGAPQQIHFENIAAFQKFQADVKNVIASLKLIDPPRPVVAAPIITEQIPTTATESFVATDPSTSEVVPPTLETAVQISNATRSIAASTPPNTTTVGSDDEQPPQANIFKQDNGGSSSAATSQGKANFPSLISELTTERTVSDNAAATTNQVPEIQLPIPTRQSQNPQINSDEITQQAIPALLTDTQNISAPLTTPEKKVDAPPPVSQQMIDAITEGSAKLRPQEIQTLRLNLRPENLGHIEVEIARDEAGHVHASLIAASPETQQILAHDISQLRQSLEQNGVSLARLDVLTTAQSQLQSQSHNQSQQQPPARPDNVLWSENTAAIPLVVNDPNNAEASKLLSLHA